MKHIKTGTAKELLDAMPDERPSFNPDKKYTRAQAERALVRGVDPEPFTKHANYHVRYKAWRNMGSPLPGSEQEVNTLLASLRGKDLSKMDKAEAPKLIAVLRHKLLGEALPVEEIPVAEVQS